MMRAGHFLFATSEDPLKHPRSCAVNSCCAVDGSVNGLEVTVPVGTILSTLALQLPLAPKPICSRDTKYVRKITCTMVGCSFLQIMVTSDRACVSCPLLIMHLFACAECAQVSPACIGMGNLLQSSGSQTQTQACLMLIRKVATRRGYTVNY